MAHHPNTDPNYVPVKELAHWGDQHPDPWVRKLAEIAGDLAHNLPVETDIIEFLGDPLCEVRNMENELANVYSDFERSEQQCKEHLTKIKALKLQLSDHETVIQLDGYRARIYDMSVDIMNLRDKVAQLEKERNDLESKLDTWKVITS